MTTWLTPFRDILLVAGFDLRSSLRSWKALGLLALYLAGSMAASGIFVSALQEIEGVLADTLGVAQTSQPGAMTAQLMQSPEVLEILGGLLGDSDLALQLVQIPPLALFYFWLALVLLPVLVTITSADAISFERGTGAARFVLSRTNLTSYVWGKAVGQLALMFVGVIAGGVGVWLVGYFSLQSFDGPATAAWMLRLGLRTLPWGAAWLGLSLGVSQVTRHWVASLAAAMVMLVAVGIGGQVLLHLDWLTDTAPLVQELLSPLFPAAHKTDLFRPEFSRRLPAMAMLIALGASWFSLGTWRLSKVDA
ncbi:MAG: ABC-type transport system involved in multi-copper enzyme maturation permease subunit [Cognaticolwellia sp.]|jgi:ABC-type transport system involved in multi-copper enzyme maturation permease subunit